MLRPCRRGKVRSNFRATDKLIRSSYIEGRRTKCKDVQLQCDSWYDTHLSLGLSHTKWQATDMLQNFINRCLRRVVNLYWPDETKWLGRRLSWEPYGLSSRHQSAITLRQLALILRRPSFSSRRCTDPEQSSAAYHICSVTSRLLLSLEDILLLTRLLPVITAYCFYHIELM